MTIFDNCRAVCPIQNTWIHRRLQLHAEIDLLTIPLAPHPGLCLTLELETFGAWLFMYTSMYELPMSIQGATKTSLLHQSSNKKQMRRRNLYQKACWIFIIQTSWRVRLHRNTHFDTNKAIVRGTTLYSVVCEDHVDLGEGDLLHTVHTDDFGAT